MDRKKELKLQYKQRKPDMGVFMICRLSNQKCYLECTPDLKSRMNSTRFKLFAGSHPCIQLQQDWKLLGESGFSIEVLERLEYDPEGLITDYSEDLEIIKIMWEEKLAQQNKTFY